MRFGECYRIGLRQGKVRNPTRPKKSEAGPNTDYASNGHQCRYHDLLGYPIYIAAIEHRVLGRKAWYSVNEMYTFRQPPPQILSNVSDPLV